MQIVLNLVNKVKILKIIICTGQDQLFQSLVDSLTKSANKQNPEIHKASPLKRLNFDHSHNFPQFSDSLIKWANKIIQKYTRHLLLNGLNFHHSHNFPQFPDCLKKIQIISCILHKKLLLYRLILIILVFFFWRDSCSLVV